MQDLSPPTLDMAPDGSFRELPAWQELPTEPGQSFQYARSGIGWRTRLLVGAVGVSLVTGLIAVVAVSFYVVLLAVPVALVLRAWRKR